MKKLIALTVYFVFFITDVYAQSSTIYFAGSTNGFYNSTINSSIPSDAVVISQSTYDNLLAAQSAGQQITHDANGNPIAVTPTPPTPTPAQNAAAAIAAGVTITSTSTSSLNGTYSVDGLAQSNINATVTYILLNGTFPGGGSTMPWLDTSGNPHVFPSIAEFKGFANAIASYVAAVSIYGDSNGAIGSLPSSSITIP